MLVIAHRGASAQLPENTLPAFERAIEIGADYIEFDVWPDLNVTHDRPQRGREYPTLEQVVELCRGRIGLMVELKSPRHRIMTEEIFAPLLGIHVYPDDKYLETLRECDQSAAYALTGAVFARDRKAISTAMDELRFAAGNFYVNDKPTGAVVGQQPFGGSRASGTNDKAGSMLNLVRWASARTIKETFVPPTKVPYSFQDAE